MKIYLEELLHLGWLLQVTFKDNDIEHNWIAFKQILCEARDKYVPQKKSSTRHNLPWYNRQLRRLCRKKQRLFNKSRKTNSSKDKEAFRKCRSHYNSLLKQAQKEHLLEVLEPKLDTNGKFLFNYIKRLNKESVGIEALTLNGNLTTDPREKVEALAKEYESVWKQEDTENLPNILPSPFPDMPDFQVTEEGVLSQLNRLDIHKSTGPDGLSPRLLNMLAPAISPILSLIFKQSIRLSIIPSDWKMQFITPILKPGKDNTLASSYRPIALTCVSSKILEHIIYSQVMDHLDTHNILSKTKHGYIRKQKQKHNYFVSNPNWWDSFRFFTCFWCDCFLSSSPKN